MKSILICIYIFLLINNIKAQQPECSVPSFYTHELIVKVTKIDTISLITNNYLSNSNLPTDNFKAVIIKIKMVSKIKGDFSKTPCFIIMELMKNEHNCLYYFKKGEVYKIYAYISKYTSDAILKKYRNNYFRLDCYQLPIIQ